MKNIQDDDLWFQHNLKPESTNISISVPSMPSEEVQMRFTGLVGERNLRQAFTFYSHIKNLHIKKENPLIMDFGAGWGRISRFFLRESQPENIFLVDCMEDSLKWMKETNNPCVKILCDPYPPLISEKITKSFDVIYAFSVFSHLSENYFIGWMNEFANHLASDGRIVLTTRNENYLDYLTRVKANADKKDWPPHLHKMQNLEEIRNRFNQGKFIFVPVAGGQELTDNFFGEAYFSTEYIKTFATKYNFELVSVEKNLPDLNQTVFVLKKKMKE